MSPASLIFQPEAYLRDNPDVARAVHAGTVISAWDHFVSFGILEGRPGVDAALIEMYRELYRHSMYPPAHLMERVHGGSRHDEFLNTGRRIAMEIHQCLQREPLVPDSVLDFGCGCGRVLHPLSQLFSNSSLYGCDIDPEAITWAAENLVVQKTIRFSVNDYLPPLSFEPGSLKLAYAISVFTHLPPEMQDSWMEELARVLCPGGLLLITTQPIDLIVPHLSSLELATMRQSGVFYKKFQSTPGLPEFYQAAWHTPEYVHNRWRKNFSVRKFEAKGIAGHHDLTLFLRH